MEDRETPPGGDEETTAVDTEQNAAETDAETRSHDAMFELRQRRAELLRGTMEHREFSVDGLECRTLDDGTLRMSGYASVSEEWYDVGDPKRGGFRERVSRGAAKRTLAESPDVVLLADHTGLPLARTKNHSLALEENPRGLFWTADLDPEDPDSQSISRKVERGLLDECSFAFQCTADEWNDDFTERTVKGYSLHKGDVSIVTYGANEATSVTTLRSEDGVLELRAGRTFSDANMQALTSVLNKIANADDNIDGALEQLSSTLGVPNPDSDDDESSETNENSGDGEPDSPQTDGRSVVIPDYTTRARQALVLLERKR